MTPFCARTLIFPGATLAAGIKATPGSSANGCGLWGVAWAWRQHATQPQEAQPRLEPKNQCVHFVVSFTFFPLLEKKKAATKIRPLAPPPKQQEADQAQRLKTPWLALAGIAGGAWPPGGRQAVWGLQGFQFLSVKEGNDRLQEQRPRPCQRPVLSLQQEGKPRTNLTWFSPQGDCSPIRGCHSHTTHRAELREKLGLLQSVSSHSLSWIEEAKDFKETPPCGPISFGFPVPLISPLLSGR